MYRAKTGQWVNVESLPEKKNRFGGSKIYKSGADPGNIPHPTEPMKGRLPAGLAGRRGLKNARSILLFA
jgi:hypothetical protein